MQVPDGWERGDPLLGHVDAGAMNLILVVWNGRTSCRSALKRIIVGPHEDHRDSRSGLWLCSQEYDRDPVPLCVARPVRRTVLQKYGSEVVGIETIVALKVIPNQH